MLTKINKTFTILLLLVLASCVDENPDLVNPPSQAETIHIRFLNLASDEDSRSLSLEYINDEMTTDAVPFAGTTALFHPPGDSVFFNVMKNGNVDYQKKSKFFFFREVTYLFAALPTPDGAPEPRPVDTLVNLQTTTTVPPNSIDAYVSLFNAYPDSTVSFSLTLGCQNGQSIASNVQYRRSSPIKNIRSGRTALSLIKSEGPNVETIGTYDFDLAARGQYALVVRREDDGSPGFYIIDHYDDSPNAMIAAVEVPENFAFIRTVNLSGKNIDITKVPGEPVAENLPASYISDFIEVSACSSLYSDTLVVSAESSTTTSELISLEVLKKYTALVYDSEDGTADNLLVLEPLELDSALGDDIAIRVLHAARDFGEMTVSLGARPSELDTLSKFKSGEVLNSSLNYGEISPAVVIPHGTAPIAAFTSSQPASFLFSGLSYFEPGGSYLLVILNDADGNAKLTLIDENTENTQVDYLEDGVLMQLIHAVPGRDFITINLEDEINGQIRPLLDNSQIRFSESIATIISGGDHTVDIDGTRHDFSVDVAERIMIIATGSGDQTEILSFVNPPMGATPENYKRRFINASLDINELIIKEQTENSEPLFNEAINYGQSSPIESIVLDNRVSIFFINGENNETLFRIDDVPFTFGKNYTIIFTGTQGTGYDAIIQQEF